MQQGLSRVYRFRTYGSVPETPWYSSVLRPGRLNVGPSRPVGTGPLGPPKGHRVTGHSWKLEEPTTVVQILRVSPT